MPAIADLLLRRARTARVFASSARVPSSSLPTWLALATLVLASSCSMSAGDSDTRGESQAELGTVALALDSDADGLDDTWEMNNFGNLAQVAAGDPDADDMTNLEEFTHGFNPNVKDGLDDADGDRYPNIFELRNGGNPTNLSVVPTATYTVNGAGGGSHTTISAALAAANVANGAYQIIGIAPGTYTGLPNLRDVTVASNKPKLLFIGLQGASKTIIDGGLAHYGWYLSNTSVVASLTFRKAVVAAYVDAPGHEVRFVDVVMRENTAPSWAAGVHVHAAATVRISGSTFLDNTGASAAQQVWGGAGTLALLNTAVGGTLSGTMLANLGGTTLTTNYCFVKGQTLTGTGNLAGATVAKIRSDGHLLWDSPLRGAGGSSTQSRIDLDAETRPTSSPDIGADQFVDSDADGLADQWEVAEAGGLGVLTSRTQDADGDGLSNELEHASLTKPTVADTDGDGLTDGNEINVSGTNPLATDTDLDDMPDGWEVSNGLSPLTANALDDADGDRYPNVFEYARGSNPSSAASVPTANYTVNGAGGGTHTTVGAAVAAANVVNGAYQIIAIAPGTYKGVANLRDVTFGTSKPKLLFIGLQGAAKTIFDGELITNNYGWWIQNSAVVASVTFQRVTLAAYVDAPAQEVRFTDVIMRDNVAPSWAAGVHVNAGAKVTISGSSFVDNAGAAAAQQIWGGAGTLTLLNTAVGGQIGGTMLAFGAGSTLVTTHCFVKGQTLVGTGNLPGSTNPKQRADLHLLWDSPLRGAGVANSNSRVDVDGELRPSSTPDIGVDQFVDSDSDGLADQWEVSEAGNLTTLTSRAQDADSDGLNNEGEYANFTKPTVADTDADGLTDGSELTVHGTSPTKADTDGDDMPDGWEVTYGLLPLLKNGFEDADGDRYPNVFEYARGTNPVSAASVPTANYTVDGTGAGTHTTVGAALAASNITNGAYQIIGIAPGVYKGVANLRDVTVGPTKPKLLFIGLQGAAKTVIDGELFTNNYGWWLQNAAVVSSLTFQRATLALYIDAPGQEVRLVDLVVRDNVAPSWAAGVHVNAGANVVLASSTLLDNAGAAAAKQVWGGSGTLSLFNTAIGGIGGTLTGTMLANLAGTTLTTTHCYVKGQTLTGAGNLAGTVNPKFRSDARLRSDSPLRSAGGTYVQSRIDIDGELRPTNTPDIGVDQFVDADSDGLADAWEVTNYGSTGAVAGGADPDADGLSNAGEYDYETDHLDADTDNDALQDGAEVAIGTNPLVVDSEGLSSDLNHDGIIDSIGAQLGYQPTQLDDDGDGVSNSDERLRGTNPLRADTDGDGVNDAADPFPLDPKVSALPNNPLDVTPPVITLTKPWYAVAQ